MNNMEVFFNNTADGHWPVGFAAVVAAKDKYEAASMLEEKLEQIGLKQEVPVNEMILVELDDPGCLILVDGEY